MKFRIWTILWVFALLASAMATFGIGGIIIAGVVVVFWALVRFSTGKAVRKLSILVVLIGTVAVLVLPVVNASRTYSLGAACRNNMRQLTLAFFTFKKEHGQFPPAFTTNEDGAPLHSWRVLLLPYLDEQELYEAIDLNEPWDSSANQQLWRRIPSVYQCPGCNRARRSGLLKATESCDTNYFAIVDEQTEWPGGCVLVQSDQYDSFFSSKESRLLLIEAADVTTCWMQPRDLVFEEALRLLRGERPGHIETNDDFLFVSATSSTNHLATTDGNIVALGNSSERTSQHLARNSDSAERSSEYRFVIRWWPLVVAERVKWTRLYSLCVFLVLAFLPITKVWWSR